MSIVVKHKPPITMCKETLFSERDVTTTADVDDFNKGSEKMISSKDLDVKLGRDRVENSITSEVSCNIDNKSDIEKFVSDDDLNGVGTVYVTDLINLGILIDFDCCEE